MTYTTHNAEETKKIAREIALTLKGGEFISLIGDLGSGKTTFVQGLVGALGFTGRVKSPTFTVMNEYQIDSKSNPLIKRVVHVDFYRFTKESELGALSLEDERRPGTVIIAEWPNIFEQDLFKPDVTVTLVHKGEDTREISVYIDQNVK
jgi:tRNA threonylcarbamoyladenosine biosynthesis protein TsaE